MQCLEPGLHHLMRRPRALRPRKPVGPRGPPAFSAKCPPSQGKVLSPLQGLARPSPEVRPLSAACVDP
eukprot:1369141-Amphidinium_carterae.1